MLGGERAQHDGVDGAEDGRIGTDTKRQREHDHGGKCRRLAQRARAVPHVTPGLLDGGFPADPAGMVLHRLDAANLHAGRSTGNLGRHACADLRLDGGFQVRLKLLVELLLDAPAANQASQSAKQTLEAGHHSCPGVAARILAIAVACASHCRVSRLSCARPCGVRW